MSVNYLDSEVLILSSCGSRKDQHDCKNGWIRSFTRRQNDKSGIPLQYIQAQQDLCLQYIKAYDIMNTG